MRKFLTIGFLMIFALTLSAQITYRFPKNVTYYKYDGKPADILLEDVRDSLAITVYLNKDYPVQWYAKTALSPVALADTTFGYVVRGKVFDEEDWTQISTGTGADVDAALTHAVSSTSADSYTINADSTITSTVGVQYYRYLQFVISAKDSSAIGSGIQLDDFELKIWERK